MRYTLLLLLLISSEIHAYKPEVGHKKILPLSQSMLISCGYSSLAQYSSEDIRLMADTSAQMDSGGVSIQPKPINNPFTFINRLQHWHFYNRNMPDGETFLGKFEKSYKYLWKWLEEGYEAAGSRHNKLIYLGGLAHFIEDMANPAHVIPVFHMLGIKDGIDDFEPRYQQIRAKIENKQLCGSLSKFLTDLSLSAKPVNVRDRLVAQTLNELETPIPSCSDFTWGDFYNLPKEGDFFGSFHKNPTATSHKPKQRKFIQRAFYIGDKGKLVSKSNPKAFCHFVQDDSRYQDFIDRLFENAIKADVALLLGAAQTLPKH